MASATEQTGPRGLPHAAQLVASASRSQSLAVSPWTFDSNGAPQGICAKRATFYNFQPALLGGPLGERAVHVRKGHLTQQTQRKHQLLLSRGKIPVSNCYSVLSTAWSGLELRALGGTPLRTKR